ncbi:hypothetical protein [Neorhodopirellula lusitana]|nr:hypothetical protein [Neorhodopirellula lusitana]
MEIQLSRPADRRRSPTEHMIVRHHIVFALIGCLLLLVVGCGASTESFDTVSSIPANSIVEVPSNATQISVTYGSGQHNATFTADTSDVESWVASLRKLKPELNSNPPSPLWLADANEYLKPTLIADERDTFSLRIGSPNGFTEQMLKFIIVRSARGGVTTVWHDPDKSHNYLWAVYK